MSKYPYLSDGVVLRLIPPAVFHGKGYVQNAPIGLKKDSTHCGSPSNCNGCSRMKFTGAPTLSSIHAAGLYHAMTFNDQE